MPSPLDLHSLDRDSLMPIAISAALCSSPLAILEQIQRAIELTQRKKQREELALCERLNLVGALLKKVGRDEDARAVYERVLRIEEWGIAESEAAGAWLRLTLNDSG